MDESRDLGRTKLKELFFAALDIPPDQREAFLRELQAEPALIETVRILLRSHENAASFLESPIDLLLHGPSLEPGTRRAIRDNKSGSRRKRARPAR